MGKLKELENSLKVLSTDRDWYDDSDEYSPTSAQMMRYQKVGKTIVEAFGLKVGRDGKVQTSAGAKSVQGVGDFVISVVESIDL